MKRTLIALSILVLVVAATTVVAEEHMIREGAEITDVLQLTPAQLTVWQNAHLEFQTTVAPLLEKQRAIAQQIETELKSSTADPCSIGGALIAQHQIADQVRAAHDALKSKVAAVLTPEQKTKFDAIATMKERHSGMMMEHQK